MKVSNALNLDNVSCDSPTNINYGSTILSSYAKYLPPKSMHRSNTMITHLWQLTGNTSHQLNQRIRVKDPIVWIYLLLQYMFPCEKLANAQSLPPKIVHKQDFYMGTCVEGYSAQLLPWRAPFL